MIRHSRYIVLAALVARAGRRRIRICAGAWPAGRVAVVRAVRAVPGAGLPLGALNLTDAQQRAGPAAHAAVPGAERGRCRTVRTAQEARAPGG